MALLIAVIALLAAKALGLLEPGSFGRMIGGESRSMEIDSAIDFGHLWQ